MTALRRQISVAGLPLLAGNRLIGLPIADIQLGKPIGVGKGLLMGGSDLRAATTNRQSAASPTDVSRDDAGRYPLRLR